MGARFCRALCAGKQSPGRARRAAGAGIGLCRAGAVQRRSRERSRTLLNVSIGFASLAGAHGASIADTLQTARVLFTAGDAASQGQPVLRTLALGELDFAYRHSRFRDRRQVSFDSDGKPVTAARELIEPAEMIVEATFLLHRASTDELRARVSAYRQHRKATQPTQASAGSVFKNPPGDYSGRLIEAAGLKGATYGSAEISTRHANFIINPGGASAADVVGLIAVARNTVRERFGIELDLEVLLRGDW